MLGVRMFPSLRSRPGPYDRHGFPVDTVIKPCPGKAPSVHSYATSAGTTKAPRFYPAAQGNADNDCWR